MKPDSYPIEWENVVGSGNASDAENDIREQFVLWKS
jgi:hypothetical protein